MIDLDELNEFQKQVERLLIEKDFDRDNDKKTAMMKIIWLIGEGIEALKALLNNDIEGCKEELADTFFYALDTMNRLDGDLIHEFYKKLDKNFKRPKRYGQALEFREIDLERLAKYLVTFHQCMDDYKKTGNFHLLQLFYLGDFF